MNMSCNDIASILDTHRSARLAPAERARVDAHLAACADCTAAWHAQNELLALRVPAMPATLLERALLASRLPQSAPARRARMPVVIGSVLLAGAAAAAVTIVSMTRSPSAEVPSVAAGEPSAIPSAAPSDSAMPAEDRFCRSCRRTTGATSVELVETAPRRHPARTANPRVPAAGAERRASGDTCS